MVGTSIGAQGEHGTRREEGEPEGTTVTFPPTVSAKGIKVRMGSLGTNRQVVHVSLLILPAIGVW